MGKNISGNIQKNNLRPIDTVKSVYDPKSSSRSIFYDNSERIRQVLNLLDDLKKRERLVGVDLGCFNGEIGLRIKEYLGNCEMYGVDIATNTREEVENRGLVFKPMFLDRKFDFEDQKFDFVFAGEIIEHLFDTDLFIDEIYRILKPGGVLIITTPNFLSFGRRINYFFGNAVFMEASHTFPTNAAGHVRYFSKGLLTKYLSSRGFNVEKFVSDEVNFPFKIRSYFLAQIIPTYGKHLIVRASRPVENED